MSNTRGENSGNSSSGNILSALIETSAACSIAGGVSAGLVAGVIKKSLAMTACYIGCGVGAVLPTCLTLTGLSIFAISKACMDGDITSTARSSNTPEAVQPTERTPMLT